MGLQVRCFLDGVQVEEPINIRDLGLSIIRDEDLHGVGSEATTQALNFIGDAAAYITGKKETEGLKAEVNLLLEQSCDDDSGDWETLVDGMLNMGQYNKACGDSCIVSIPVENTSCETVMKNRFDQSVDMDKATGFNGITPLPAYAGLAMDITLPTRELSVINEGNVLDTGDVMDMTFFVGLADDSTDKYSFRPTYANVKSEEINQSELQPNSFFAVDHGILGNGTLSPVFLFDDTIKCFTGNFDYQFRFKGTPNFSDDDFTAFLTSVKIRIAVGEYPDALTDIYTQALPFTNLGAGHGFVVNTPFDYSFSGTTNIKPGQGLYAFIEFYGSVTLVLTGTTVFDKETYAKVNTVKACPPTNTKAYLIHEALSRATEAVTDYCVRVKSEYYGRTDSKPFAFRSDGCGGLRLLTSGLKIRNAANPTFFASLQDLIEGLQAIDNIGMCLETDPERSNYLLLRVEGIDFFYRDIEIMRCPAIATGKEAFDLTKSYSKIDVGYKKWETQANFGLDEFNSNREYRTSLTAISSALDIMSGLVTGEYAIEITREQQYVETSEADTTYDDETFLICLARVGPNLAVEQGNVISPSNIFSPGSIYNYRLTPVRNLMRWFRSIAASYPNIIDTDNRLFFSSGKGNILASGEISLTYGDITCRQENGVLMENQDISPQVFADRAAATPLWKNETFSYEYPMSIKEYNMIKANPYGYISYQCGNGDWAKGWIKEIDFKPFDGMATITLKKKWS